MLEAFAPPPFHVLADLLGFGLREGGEQGEHEFPVGGERGDVLLFEPDFHAEGFQLADGFQQVDGVAGEPRD
ncbi:Uncharacterised protein [Chlamydia trachomatis]|nr:Uncharacterised protein [Chlamydia trachomatis]